MRPAQIIGLLLWRGGLAFAGAWALYEGLRVLLRSFDLPRMAEAGIALVLTGSAMVLLSLVLERVADARAEGDLSR